MRQVSLSDKDPPSSPPEVKDISQETCFAFIMWTLDLNGNSERRCDEDEIPFGEGNSLFQFSHSPDHLPPG